MRIAIMLVVAALLAGCVVEPANRAERYHGGHYDERHHVH